MQCSVVLSPGSLTPAVACWRLKNSLSSVLNHSMGEGAIKKKKILMGKKCKSLPCKEETLNKAYSDIPMPSLGPRS